MNPTEQSPRDGLADKLQELLDAYSEPNSETSAAYALRSHMVANADTIIAALRTSHPNAAEPVPLRGVVADETFAAAEAHMLGKDPPAPQDDARADGYREAFYELAAILNLPAQPISPREAWEGQMKPRILAARSDDARADVRGLVLGLRQVRYLLKSIANGDDQRETATKAAQIVEEAANLLAALNPTGEA